MFKFDYYSNKRLLKKELYCFLYKSFTEVEWLNELTNSDSNIYEFMKEEVQELFISTKGYLGCLDFESLYKLSIEIIVIQINKGIKKQKKCFFLKKGLDYIDILYLIKQRLVNNIKNLFDPKRKINVLNINLSLMDKIYENYELDTRIWDLQKLAISNPQIIIENIKELVNNYELSLNEIKELGEKLNMNFSNIVELDLSSQFKNLRKDSNNQTFFLFEIEEVA